MTTSPQKSQCQQIWRLWRSWEGYSFTAPCISSKQLLPREKGSQAFANTKDKEGRVCRWEERAWCQGAVCAKSSQEASLHTISLVRHLAGWPTPEGDLGFLWRQQLAGLCRRWGSVITQGRVRRAQEASCWLWTCKDWCHLVLAAASHDPRELLRSPLVSQLFGAPLNKHKVLNSCFSYSFKVCLD